MYGSGVGKVLRLKKKNIHKTYNWFEKRGRYAVFFGRFVPIIRSLVSIPAGMAKMPMLLFLFLTTTGSLIWNTVLIFLGRFAGESWGKIAGYVGGYADVVIYIVIGLAVLGIVLLCCKRRVKIIRFK